MQDHVSFVVCDERAHQSGSMIVGLRLGENLRGVAVVGGHDDQRARMLRGILQSQLDGVVKSNRLTDLLARLRGVGSLIDLRALDLQKKTRGRSGR